MISLLMMVHNNPAGDVLTIQHFDAIYERTIKIINIQGKEVKSEIMPVGTTMIFNEY